MYQTATPKSMQGKFSWSAVGMGLTTWLLQEPGGLHIYACHMNGGHPKSHLAAAEAVILLGELNKCMTFWKLLHFSLNDISSYKPKTPACLIQFLI